MIERAVFLHQDNHVLNVFHCAHAAIGRLRMHIEL